MSKLRKRKEDVFIAHSLRTIREQIRGGLIEGAGPRKINK